MKKIPTVFVRNPDNRSQVIDAVTPGCEWVLAGEGTPTWKYDGTCVMLNGDGWWARRQVKAGKPAPPNYVEVEFDDTTGKSFGWEPIEASSFYAIFKEAFDAAEEIRHEEDQWPWGTHELDGTVVARLAGEVHIIDPVGREVPAERYVRDTYGLTAVIA